MKGKKSALLLAGGAVGTLNGLFGGGGGMVAVPALTRAGVPTLRAHATAIAVILPACLVSAVVYLVCGLVPYRPLIPVAVGVTAGGLVGAKLLPRLSAHIVTFLFAAFMLAAGIRMMLR